MLLTIPRVSAMPTQASATNRSDRTTPCSDAILFAPAELDWFRDASPSDSRPMFAVVFEATPEPGSRPWWRELLDDLS